MNSPKLRIVLASMVVSTTMYSQQDVNIQYRSNLEGEWLYQERAIILKEAAVVTMDGMELQADVIRIDWDQHMLTAFGQIDSHGTIQGKPVFMQGDNRFAADTIRYQFETKQGWVHTGSTKQSKGYLHGERIKLVDDSTYFLGPAAFTTCNHVNPHFAIVTKQARLDLGERIVTGPAYVEILQIPTPLILPFGFFPMMNKRASGFILPQFQDKRQWGLGLTGFGHYWALDDHWDMRLTGDLYTRGSWGLNASSSYRYRYKYSGQFGLRVNRTRFGDPRYQSSGQFMDSRDYRISWTHRQDAKAHPTRSFGAKVDLSTGSFFKNTSTDPSQFLKNDMSSSVSYSKRWPGSPFQLTAAARQRQNNQTGTMTLTLPEVNIGMNRIQPFRRLNPVGKTRWYEKIGLTYQMNSRNETRGSIDELMQPDILFQPSRLKSGMQHKAAMSANLKLLRFITVNPSMSYVERWYPYAMNHEWNADSNRVDRDTVSGFFPARDFQMAANMSTTLYGMFNFKQGPLKAIRHVAYPSIGLNLRPDFSDPFWGSYQQVQTDSSGSMAYKSRFESFIYGSPTHGEVAAVTFRLRNTLGGKWLSKQDSGKANKFNILDDFTVASAYNAALPQYQWTPLTVRSSTSLAKNKLRLSYQGAFDWYGQDSLGNRLPTMAYQMDQGPLRPSLHVLSADLRLRGGNSTGRLSAPINSQGLQEDLYDDFYGNMDYMSWHAPWTLNLGYALRMSPNPSTSMMESTQSLRVNGTWEPTANWRMGLSSGYDFVAKQLTFTTLDLSRQLHCWEMRLRWVPFGYARSYHVSLGVKAPLLKDLKVERRRGLGDY